MKEQWENQRNKSNNRKMKEQWENQRNERNKGRQRETKKQ